VFTVLVGIFLFNRPLEKKPQDIPSGDTFIVDSIDATYVYDNNTHEYYGTLMLPNPCYSLSTEAIVRESYPEQVTLAFTTDGGEPDQMCIQVIQEEEFRIIFTASAEAVVDATFNGVPVTLVLTEGSSTTDSLEEMVEDSAETS